MNQIKENTQERDPKKDYILSPYYKTFYLSYLNTSFSPDIRAANDIIEYSELLNTDLKELNEKGGSGNYKEKFISKLMDLVKAQSNCVSWMITGRSGLNVNRVNKANETRKKKFEDFWNWREKYFKSVDRVPTLPPEDVLKKAEERLIKLTNLQEEYKEINKEIRKQKFNQNKTPFTDILSHLKKLEFSEDSLDELRKDYNGHYSIPAFVLTNNNAKIKNTKEKIENMLIRIKRKNTWQDILFKGGRVTIEDDRVKIYHDNKPSEDIRKVMKENGFRYSPHWVCWSRKHTGNALFVVNQIKHLL